VRAPSRPDAAALVLLLIGLLAVATGVLPGADAREVARRVLPLLAFLATVVVLAELVRAAEVFDVAATLVARGGRGRPAALFGLCVLLATVTTVTLNLDTTAVLLTPVLLALAARLGLRPVALAMTTVWLANTASLLLPVSNLTNVLAADRVALPPAAFAARMALPAVVAVLVTAALLWVLFWRGTPGYAVPPRHVPGDRVLAGLCVAAVLLLLAGVLAGLPLEFCSAAGALVAVAGFAARRPSALRFTLVPWRLLVLVPGVFLVLAAVGAHGLDALVRSLMDDGSPARAAAVGAVLANAVNNLPAYLAGEAAAPDRDALLGLLIGVNVGPVVTPWASLATLIWFERCRAHGVVVPVRLFVLTGALLAVLAVPAAVLALLVRA
jgi:arsenical pump membrane protein